METEGEQKDSSIDVVAIEFFFCYLLDSEREKRVGKKKEDEEGEKPSW